MPVFLHQFSRSKMEKKLPPEEVFGKVFKMNKSVLKKPSYHVSQISTDGIGCTITFTLDGQSTKRGGKRRRLAKKMKDKS
jgi:hypothetical protein